MGGETMTQVKERMDNNSYDSYQHYLAGNSWHCPDAPINMDIPLQVKLNTGAHYWKEFHNDKKGEFYCRYCFEIRVFSLRSKRLSVGKSGELKFPERDKKK